MLLTPGVVTKVTRDAWRVIVGGVFILAIKHARLPWPMNESKYYRRRSSSNWIWSILGAGELPRCEKLSVRSINHLVYTPFSVFCVPKDNCRQGQTVQSDAKLVRRCYWIFANKSKLIIFRLTSADFPPTVHIH